MRSAGFLGLNNSQHGQHGNVTRVSSNQLTSVANLWFSTMGSNTTECKIIILIHFQWCPLVETGLSRNRKKMDWKTLEKTWKVPRIWASASNSSAIDIFQYNWESDCEKFNRFSKNANIVTINSNWFYAKIFKKFANIGDFQPKPSIGMIHSLPYFSIISAFLSIFPLTYRWRWKGKISVCSKFSSTPTTPFGSGAKAWDYQTPNNEGG